MLALEGVGAMLLLTGCNDASSTGEVPAALRPPVLLSAEVDRSEATAGDPVRYTVTLDHDPGIQASMPEIFTKIQGFRVADIKEEGPVTRDGRQVQKKIFELRAEEPGSYILPELKLTYKDAKGAEQTAGAPQIFVEIKSSLKPGAEEEDILDIKSVEKPPLDYKRLALLIGGIVAGLALIGGVILYVRRRRRALEPPPPPRPAWELAREELAALEAQGLIAVGDARGYCYALSEILRRYLERRYGFPALEETTEEILASFRRSAVPQGRPQDLARRVLTGTDWVKYAKQVPSQAEAEEMLQAARTFIDATEPPPPLPEAEAAGKEVR
jgi:hypothetical protein